MRAHHVRGGLQTACAVNGQTTCDSWEVYREPFTLLAEFVAEVGQMLDHMKASRPRPGVASELPTVTLAAAALLHWRAT